MRDVERRGFGASKKRGSTGELALQESSDLLARPRAGVGRGRGGCCLFLPSLSESQFGSSTVTLLVGSLDGFSILLTCGRCTYAPRSQANGKIFQRVKGVATPSSPFTHTRGPPFALVHIARYCVEAPSVRGPASRACVRPSGMLIRTRAVIALAQPSKPEQMDPEGESIMFNAFRAHIDAHLNTLRRNQQLPLEAGPSNPEREVANPAARYTPARWLLMSCYEVAHAEEFYQIKRDRREAMAVALFARLTGDKRLLNLTATESLALYEEAAAAYRRAGQLAAIRPAKTKADVAAKEALLKNLAQWLCASPDTMAMVGRHEPRLRTPTSRPTPASAGRHYGFKMRVQMREQRKPATPIIPVFVPLGSAVVPQPYGRAAYPPDRNELGRIQFDIKYAQ